MAINFDVLIETARRVLLANTPPSQIPQGNLEIDLAAIKDTACQVLAARIAKDPGRFYLLQQDYSVALDGSGVGDFLTATGSITGDADIYADSIPMGNVQDAYNNSLIYIPHLFDFYRPASTQFAYYTLQDRRIRTRAIATAVQSAADIVGVVGPLTITASFISTDLTYWPDQFFDDLVATIVNIAQTKLAAPANAA
jgi:hypothetical protein